MRMHAVGFHQTTFDKIGTIRSSNAVRSLSLSPDGVHIACSSLTQVEMWTLTQSMKSTLLRTFEGHTSPVRSVVFSPDGQFLVTAGGTDGTVCLRATEHASVCVFL